MKRDNPTMLITFTTNQYTVENGKKVGPVEHKEHAFLYSAWCGDGTVDADFGEKYDDGVNNGKP